MQHTLVEKFEELNQILLRFFEENYHRHSTPVIMSTEEQNVFNLACQIYKRGFIKKINQAQKPSVHSHSIDNREKNSHKNIISQIKIHTGEQFKDFLNYQFLSQDKKTFFLLDKNFIDHHQEISNILLQKNLSNYFLYFPSESSKNLTTIKNILTCIPEQTKNIFVIGGGITLDIGGFIAGLLSVPVHYLPTTLLSAVDASIGGKTGVNFAPYGKNQVGLFYEAESLHFVPEFLHTLSQEEKNCGVIEAAKHAYLFGEFDTDLPLLTKIILGCISDKELTEIVQKNFSYKLFIVKQDPKEENGIRSSLNFGHTLAHIIEALAEEKYIEFIPHGLAVAYGIKFLFDAKLISAHKSFQDLIYTVILTKPIDIKKYISQEIMLRLLSQDKKNTERQKCVLCLPKYGLFSHKKENILEEELKYNKITKTFFLVEIAECMAGFLNHGFELESV